MYLCTSKMRIKCIAVLSAIVLASCWWHLRLEVVLHRYGTIAKQSYTCKLRDLDPWDEGLGHYVHEQDYIINCGNVRPIMYVNETGYIDFDKTQLQKLSIEKPKCSYRNVTRISDQKITYGDKVALNPPAFVKSRVFQVICLNKTGKQVYNYVHYNVYHQETNDRNKLIRQEDGNQPNIIFLGFDATSRSKTLRSLPLTAGYLLNVLGAYDFKRFTKVGENTFPNLLAMLAGIDWRDFYESSNMSEFYDDLPLFWKRDPSYATLMCENDPRLETFVRNDKGFRKPPADHYCRPLFVAMKESKPMIVNELSSKSHCYGDQLTLEVQMQYLQKFFQNYWDKKKIGYLWNNDAHHEYKVTKNADKPIFNLLKWLKTNGFLENTVVMLSGDHGFRLSGPSFSLIGRHENTNPVFFMYIPEKLKAKYSWISENLHYNAENLVTAYDVHKTVVDMIDGTITNDKESPISMRLTPRSLLRKIPRDRTCEDAGIPYLFCIRCFDNYFLNASLPYATLIANFSVSTINKILDSNEHCTPLALDHVRDIQLMEFNLLNNQSGVHSEVPTERFVDTSTYVSGLYLVSYRTSPNDGIYEGMIKYKPALSGGLPFMEKVGDPVRMNSYGSQPYCIKVSNLKPFCYCTKH